MSHLDSELTALRVRLAALEEQKRLETEAALQKKEHPLKVLEGIIEEKRAQVRRNRYSSSIPLARFHDLEKLGFLEPIFNMLKDIQGRLDKLERR
jgi:hypothetical protein